MRFTKRDENFFTNRRFNELSWRKVMYKFFAEIRFTFAKESSLTFKKHLKYIYLKPFKIYVSYKRVLIWPVCLRYSRKKIANVIMTIKLLLCNTQYRIVKRVWHILYYRHLFVTKFSNNIG